MCQAIPRQVLEVTVDRALALVDGEPTWVDRRPIDDLAVGEYVVVYAGVALERVSAEDAVEILRFYEELETMLSDAGDPPTMATSTNPGPTGGPVS